MSQLLRSISHCPTAVVGTWSKVFVPPVPSTTTPTYAVNSLTGYSQGGEPRGTLRTRGPWQQ